jgi:FkbM family methyltransferase
MRDDLIYDVGMNNGDDSAYYLSLGYRVLAIEAEIGLAQGARERFPEEIAQGRFVLLNIAVAPVEGVGEFWICEGKSEWNSFNRANASKAGQTCHPVQVRCRRFRDILATYGVPRYLKIDVEGYDRYCIADLDPSDLPQYLSSELQPGAVDDLLALRTLGYDRFKIIRQEDHTQLTVQDGVSLGGGEKVSRFDRLVERLRWLSARTTRCFVAPANSARSGQPLSAPGWKFPGGSSGPFGEETAGEWQSFEEALYTWLHWSLGHGAGGVAGNALWADVHATK